MTLCTRASEMAREDVCERGSFCELQTLGLCQTPQMSSIESNAIHNCVPKAVKKRIIVMSKRHITIYNRLGADFQVVTWKERRVGNNQ